MQSVYKLKTVQQFLGYHALFILYLLVCFTWLCSNFSDIFDVDHFIEALKGDVHIVKSLPREYLLEPKAGKQFQSWSNVKYYEDTIASVWRDYKVTDWLLSSSFQLLKR